MHPPAHMHKYNSVYIQRPLRIQGNGVKSGQNDSTCIVYTIPYSLDER